MSEFVAPPLTLHERRTKIIERRKPSMKWLVTSIVAPRRRAHRREEAGQAVCADWHPPRMLWWAIGIPVLCAVDAFWTLQLLGRGATELNPFMAPLIHDVDLFVTIKMWMTVISVMLVVILAQFPNVRRRAIQRTMFGLLGGYVALVLYEALLLQVT